MLIPHSQWGGDTFLFFFVGALRIGSLPLRRMRRSGLGAASCLSDELLDDLLHIAAAISASDQDLLYGSSLLDQVPSGTSEMYAFRSYTANHRTCVRHRIGTANTSQCCS